MASEGEAYQAKEQDREHNCPAPANADHAAWKLESSWWECEREVTRAESPMAESPMA